MIQAGDCVTASGAWKPCQIPSLDGGLSRLALAPCRSNFLGRPLMVRNLSAELRLLTRVSGEAESAQLSGLRARSS